MTTHRPRAISWVLAALLLARPVAAQDTLRLDALQRAAERRDPRLRQLELQRARTALRLRSLDAERLPALAFQAQAQYQSDVTTLPIRLPGGQAVPAPPHDTYDARLDAQQRMYDPAQGARRAVERAQLAQAEAQIRATLYGTRQQVNDAFFTAALLGLRAQEVQSTIGDLEAQLRVVEARVREGAALRGEAAAVEAALLRRRQDEQALRADREAALELLRELTGVPAAASAVLALPDLASPAARAGVRDPLPRARPEYEQFARTRELLERQEAVAAAQTRPRLGAFARLGYGRPGLNPLARSFDSYWLGGVQLQWAPWNWGTTRRERESLALQREIVATDEAAFTDALRRSLVRDRSTIARLEETLALDDRIVALREQVARETRLRFAESVITAAEYVDRESDVLDARLARAAHQVELAQARARYLTTLGVEIP